MGRQWEGIRRTHGASPDQATPLEPPLLWECLEATPTVNDDAPLADLRDHAVSLIGFVAACRASELVGIDVEHLEEHDNGIVLHVSRSKNNQRGETDQLEILPRSKTPGRCPVAAIHAWRRAARIDTGPLLRGLERTGQPPQWPDQSHDHREHPQRRHHPDRHRPARLLTSLPPGRVRHLSSPPRPTRPGHRRPDRPPVTRVDRKVRTHVHG